MAEFATIRVTVCHCPGPRELFEVQVVVPAASSVLEAIQASALASRFPGIDLAQASAGIWGRKAAPDDPLHEGDRVEVYRPLRVDPKLARRERFRKQGVRAAGLFARRDAGKTSQPGGES